MRQSTSLRPRSCGATPDGFFDGLGIEQWKRVAFQLFLLRLLLLFCCLVNTLRSICVSRLLIPDGAMLLSQPRGRLPSALRSVSRTSPALYDVPDYGNYNRLIGILI